MLIFNTLSKKKRNLIFNYYIFLYICGATIYDNSHIGHGRMFLFFDILLRYFVFNGLDVFFVRNITDIDNKIEKKTQSYLKTLCFTATTYALKLFNDCLSLSLLRPTFEPFATGFIFYIHCVVDLLIKKNYAYITNVGDIYFKVSLFNTYGFLSSQKNLLLEHCLTSLNVMVKNNSHDFALWKSFSVLDQFLWFSKWGFGRPGWHIECTVMIFYFFGEYVDLHGGGLDLVFPHHENEYAQAHVLTKKFFSKFWLHTGLLFVNKKKMSKSFLNFIRINTILNIFSSDCLRFFSIFTPYRSVLVYNFHNLIMCSYFVNKIFFFFLNLSFFSMLFVYENVFFTKYGKSFFFYMDNDLDIPHCLLLLNNLIDIVFNLKKHQLFGEIIFLANIILCFCFIFGFFQNFFNFKDLILYQQCFFKGCRNIILQCTESIFFLRFKLRVQKQWFLSDFLRCKLYLIGVSIGDFHN